MTNGQEPLASAPHSLQPSYHVSAPSKPYIPSLATTLLFPAVPSATTKLHATPPPPRRGWSGSERRQDQPPRQAQPPVAAIEAQ